MSREGKVHSMTCEETANLLEEIAEHIKAGERFFELQLPISQAQAMMLELDHMDGLKLLNRVALLLLSKDRMSNVGYDFTRKRVEALKPLDPIEDSQAIQELAHDIRRMHKSS